MGYLGWARLKDEADTVAAVKPRRSDLDSQKVPNQLVEQLATPPNPIQGAAEALVAPEEGHSPRPDSSPAAVQPLQPLQQPSSSRMKQAPTSSQTMRTPTH